MDQSKFEHFLLGLAELFDKEGRPGGTEAAEAIRSVLPLQTKLPPGNTLLSDMRSEAFGLNPTSIGQRAAEIHDDLDWHFSGLSDGRIREEIALQMVTTEIIGPDGMIFHPTVRVGLFAQSKDLDYVTRIHAAEETFIMLCGSGMWSCGDAPLALRRGGDLMHHPSNAAHKSVTTDEPFVAAWRWTGKIAYEEYELIG